MGDNHSDDGGLYISPPRLAAANFVVLCIVAFFKSSLAFSIWRMGLFAIALILTVAFIYSLIKTYQIPQTRMAPEEVDVLIMYGPFATVRHPNFTGILLMNIAFFCFFPTIWLLPFILFFSAGWYHEAKHEESVLIDKFGQKYKEYMQHTGMFLPKLE